MKAWAVPAQYCERSQACINRRKGFERDSMRAALAALREPENLSRDGCMSKLFCNALHASMQGREQMVSSGWFANIAGPVPLGLRAMCSVQALSSVRNVCRQTRQPGSAHGVPRCSETKVWAYLRERHEHQRQSIVYLAGLICLQHVQVNMCDAAQHPQSAFLPVDQFMFTVCLDAG